MNITQRFTVMMLLMVLTACTSNSNITQSNDMTSSSSVKEVKISIENNTIRHYEWLKGMYVTEYFPPFLVDKVKAILLEVCADIESQNPKNLDELYSITNVGVVKINQMQHEFYENGSEIETAARDTMGIDFQFIAKAYGFDNADSEALIDKRDW